MGTGPSADTFGTARRGAGSTWATQRAARSRSAAPRASSSLRRALARSSSWAWARRLEAPTMRSRSARATSCSSGPSRPPTSAPREIRASTSAVRVSSRSSTDDTAARSEAGSRSVEVADPFDRGAQRTHPRLLVGLGRVEAQPGPQRGGEGVGQPAGLGQRDGQGSGRHLGAVAGGPGCCRPRGRRIEPPPDQGREAGQLGGADPPAVPGRHEEVVPVGHGLPQRHREQQVAGVRRAVGRTEGRLVEHVELGLARVTPGAQGLEVVQGVLRDEGLAEPPGGGRCGGAVGRGDHGARPYTGCGGAGALPSESASQVL